MNSFSNVEDEFVRVAEFDRSFEAHLAAGMLTSAGILVRLADEHMATLNPLEYRVLIGGIKLMVPRSSYDEALELLKAAGDLRTSAPSC